MAEQGSVFQPILVANQAELDQLSVKPGQYIVVQETGSQYLDLSDRRISIGGGGGTHNDVIKTCGSHLEFPSVGAVNCIYIATSEEKIYRFSPSDLKYYCVGSDYSNIGVINGGNAENS